MNVTPISRGIIFGPNTIGPFGWVSERNLIFLLEMGGHRKSKGSNFLFGLMNGVGLCLISMGLWVDFLIKSKVVASNKNQDLN